MDGTAPDAKRTRSRQAQVHKGLSRKIKKEETHRESVGSVAFSTYIGVRSASRTRSRQSFDYRYFFDKIKKETQNKSVGIEGLLNESGLGFVGNSLTVDFESAQNSWEVGNNNKSGRGPMDNPVFIEDEHDDDDDGAE